MIVFKTFNFWLCKSPSLSPRMKGQKMNNLRDICPLWEKQTNCPRITMFFFFSYFSRFRFVAQFLRLTSWWEVIQLLFLRNLGNYWIGHWTEHLLWKQLTNLRYLYLHFNVKLYADRKTVFGFLSILVFARCKGMAWYFGPKTMHLTELVFAHSLTLHFLLSL